MAVDISESERNPFDDLADIDIEKIEAEDEKTARQLEGWLANLAVGLGILLVVLIILAILAVYPTEIITATLTTTNYTVTENETVIHSTPVTISFQHILSDPSAYVGQKLTLLGFLQKKELSRGLVKYYLLDDFFRKIEVRNVPAADRDIFPLDAKTKYPYEVTGTLQQSYQDIFLAVESLFISTRPVNETLSIVYHNRTVTETNISYSTKKTTVLKYWAARLFGPARDHCSDGTVAGSCAKEKPYFCTDWGVIISDAERCGCPEGQQEEEGVCV